MKTLKNFEALFVMTVALACGASYALDKSSVEAQTPDMQVVVVSAKRMTAEQKLQSVMEERATTLAADAKKASMI
ncbi:hypothetical protein FHW83_004440 [Duganella sp. SG902]|uniref:hypothetical protein n=1 Tax=Duganella sp. SG902 TaxID=2587016 RepID=UPI00159DDBAC|nr:hypothetical protein [Duganella sp. SG902]NVM78612.1 hypothetical protein [Duganella sp. SG902]